jgi:hypothetical protein
MTARLVAFQYEPRGTSGWASPILEFGVMCTAVRGENGSGKTPLMKGIMTALGQEVSLDPDIQRNCARARVELSIDGARVVIARNLDEEFSVDVTESARTTNYVSDAEFSTWMLGALGIQQRQLTSVRREQTQIYLNTFYPLLWVDQDTGWTSLYSPPTNRNFIQSQYAEMVRVVLGLPPRHPFRSRDDYDKAKRRLEVIDKHIVAQRTLVQQLRANCNVDARDEDSLRQQRDRLKVELALFEKAVENIASITRRYDEEIAQLDARRSALLNDRFSLTGRQRQLELALNEIDGEVEVLAANVQATDLLKEFCGNPACRLFQPHFESYGRTLLFLKDQMKDLKSADGTLAKEIVSVSARVEALDRELQNARTTREATVIESPYAQVHTQITTATKALLEVELRMSQLEQIGLESKRFERALEEREQQVQLVDNLKPKSQRREDAAAIDARLALTKKMDEWLEILGATLPRGVSVNEDFEFVIRGEVFSRDSSISGSTRTRVVLAFHAALLEAALDLGGNHPGWLFLDAPKQHELSQVDFNAYIERLSDVARRHPGKVQTVFSIANTDTALPLRSEDLCWMPTNGIGRGAKYLWPADKIGRI